MDDTDRLAALLDAIGLDFWDETADTRSDAVVVDFDYGRFADRLIAAGVGFRDEIDVERLARAIENHSHVGAPSETVISCGRGHVEVCAAAIAREYAKDGTP